MTNRRELLVADASKVVRASLAKHLANRFRVREEGSGESAWQTLVLDSSIAAVVCGLTLNKLDGLALLERIRASKLSRLNQLPFFLVISSSFSEADREEALARGVTDFIVKGATSPLIESIVSAWLERRAAASAELAGEAFAAADEALDQVGVQTDVSVNDLEPAGDGEGGENAVLAEEVLEEHLARRLPGAGEGQGVGVLAFGLDGYEELVGRYGADLAERTTQKFAYMLARKIRSEDCIGQLTNGRVVIVAASTTASVCTRFASRICKAMAAAQISVRGQRLDLTVSVGVAVVPEDGPALSSQEMLRLAHERLELAQHAGGNRLVACNATAHGGGRGSCETFLPLLKELLATIDPVVLRPALGNVGMQLMPILRELERSFRFGLPLDEMNKRLWDRARAERMLT